MYTPESNIMILKCPINDYEDELYFKTIEQQQATFFDNVLMPHKIFDDNYTFVKREKGIKIALNYEEAINYNYLIYKNKNKYYYCFITGYNYINDNTTLINFDLDVIQTYLFDLEYKKSLIDRQMSTNDIPEENTTQDNFELNEYITQYQVDIDEMKTSGNGQLTYIVNISDTFNEETHPCQAYTLLAGTVIGGALYAFKNDGQGLVDLQNFINDLDHEGKGDAIKNMWEVPTGLLEAPIESNHHFNPGGQWFYKSLSINRPTKLDGYTPENKKLLSYPFCFLEVTNNNGMVNTYRYEDFKHNNIPGSEGYYSDECVFYLYAVSCMGGSIKLIPYEYKGTGDDRGYQDEGIMAGKFPACGWHNDFYTNWLTQNALNLSIGVAGDVLGTPTVFNERESKKEPKTIDMKATTANTVVNGLSSAGSAFAQEWTAHNLPDTTKGNTNGGDLMTAIGQNVFTIRRKTIKKEYAQKIDNFYSMYGYKYNRIGTVNFDNRPNWNYIKLTKCCFYSKVVPSVYMDKIKSIYETGITFWHNINTFLNYDNLNRPIA